MTGKPLQAAPVPPDIRQHAVRLYYRFNPSHPDIDEIWPAVASSSASSGPQNVKIAPRANTLMGRRSMSGRSTS